MPPGNLEGHPAGHGLGPCGFIKTFLHRIMEGRPLGCPVGSGTEIVGGRGVWHLPATEWQFKARRGMAAQPGVRLRSHLGWLGAEGQPKSGC